MIDRDYWHLVRGTDDAFRLRLDAYSVPLSARRRMRRVTDEPAKQCAGEQQLHADRQRARAVPAEAAVEELLPSGPQERNEVLSVGCATGRGPDSCRIEQTSAQHQE